MLSSVVLPPVKRIARIVKGLKQLGSYAAAPRKSADPDTKGGKAILLRYHDTNQQRHYAFRPSVMPTRSLDLIFPFADRVKAPRNSHTLGALSSKMPTGQRGVTRVLASQLHTIFDQAMRATAQALRVVTTASAAWR